MHHIPRSKYTFEELIEQSRAILRKHEDVPSTRSFLWSCTDGKWISNPELDK